MDLILVRNKTNHLINLTKCQLQRFGDTGLATFAEFSTLWESLERVDCSNSNTPDNDVNQDVNQDVTKKKVEGDPENGNK